MDEEKVLFREGLFFLCGRVYADGMTTLFDTDTDLQIFTEIQELFDEEKPCELRQGGCGKPAKWLVIARCYNQSCSMYVDHAACERCKKGLEILANIDFKCTHCNSIGAMSQFIKFVLLKDL